MTKTNSDKETLHQMLVDCAKRRGQVTYSELTDKLRTKGTHLSFAQLYELLCEISTDEYQQGRGMLSAIVVTKNGDQQPGDGFYKLAKDLGIKSKNELECWIDQMKKVHDVWTKK